MAKKTSFVCSVFTVILTLFASACSTPPAPPAPQEPEIRTLTQQEVHDLMVGTCIQATRNCDSAALIEGANQLLDEGKEFQLIAPEDLPDDWTVVAASGGIGGGGAWEHVIDRTNGQNLPTIEDGTITAMNTLSDYLGTNFDAIIRNEAGAATFAAFVSATSIGVPLVDACPAGRAKPEVQQSVAFINGLSTTPAALVSSWGDVVILEKAIDDYRYEDIARGVAVASGGRVSQARNVMSGAELKRGTIHGMVSEAILLGRTVREARERNQDPIQALIDVTQGYKLFQGIVTKSEPTGERGFSYSDVELKGTNEYDGHTYQVWVKNENMISWLDGEPDVMSPDLIYNLDPETGDAIAAGYLGGYPLDIEVAMVGRQAPSPVWRTEQAIEAIGPRHFGFDFDYVPIEELQQTREALSSQ